MGYSIQISYERYEQSLSDKALKYFPHFLLISILIDKNSTL